MRFWGRVVAVLAVAGCSGSVPNADHITGQNVPILASSVASDVDNKGDESVKFGHIHHLAAGATTGPVVWWLSSPVGVDLNLTDRHIDIRQVGIFAAANGHFASAEAGLAELLAHPGDFYVNFHSDNCPGGFARGFLP